MPAEDGRPERLRLDAGPRRRLVQVRPGRRERAQRPALPARDHGARDQLGLRRGLAGGAGMPGHGAVAARPSGRKHAHQATHRLRRRAHAAADRALRGRPGPAHPGLRARLRLRPPARKVAAHRARLHPGRRRARGPGPDPHPDLRYPPRPRRIRRPRADPAEGGRHPLLRAVLGSPPHPGKLRGRLPAAGLDRAPLAALAGPRPLPRPPLARPPGPERPDPQGPDVRAHRRDRRGGDHLAARDAGRRAQLGLPVHLDARRDVRAVGPVHPRLRVGGQRLLRLPPRPGRT